MSAVPRMYRTLAGLVACLVAALFLVGMTFSASVEAEADFRLGNGSEPKSLDPHLATGEPEGRVLRSVFEGLMRLEAGTLKPVGGVAESFEISEDETRYTFHLRENARWSDGRPVTAHDFVYSWQRLLDPKVAAQYAYLLHGVVGARALNTFSGYVETLRGPVTRALRDLQGKAPDGVDARDWQKFLANHHVHSALGHTEDRVLVERLAQRTGRLSSRELAEFERRSLA